MRISGLVQGSQLEGEMKFTEWRGEQRRGERSIDVTERSSTNTLSVNTETNICSKRTATSELYSFAK